MPHPPKPTAPLNEVTRWIQSLDTTGDGKISRKELQTALSKLELGFPDVQGWWAMRQTNTNGSAYINTNEELEQLENYMKKHLHKCIIDREKHGNREAVVDRTYNKDGVIITQQELDQAVNLSKQWYAEWKAHFSV